MQDPIFFDVVSRFRQDWVEDQFNVHLIPHSPNQIIFENWANYALEQIKFDLDLNIDENVVQLRQQIAGIFESSYGGTIQWFPYYHQEAGAVRLSFPNRESLAAFVLQWNI